MCDFEPDLNYRGLPVPDPYEGTMEDFRQVADILERCLGALLREIIDKYKLRENNS
jgi:protein-tyrosine-phosphatase